MSAVRSPRPPTLLDALAGRRLIALLTLTMVLFGTAAADGPLQIALLLSAAFALAHRPSRTAIRRHPSERCHRRRGSAMGAIFILLAVGADRNVEPGRHDPRSSPTVSRFLRPAIFFATVALICAVVGVVTGSSWTTAATLGVAVVGMAPILGMSTAITAGAVISGAYMGDKMSPLSETTILVPELVGV